MSKTRNEKKRNKEEIFFYITVAIWVITVITFLTVRVF